MSLEDLANDLIENYEDMKYRPITLFSFAVYWDIESCELIEDPKVFAEQSYYKEFRGFFESVKRKNYDEWKEPALKMPKSPQFEVPSFLNESVTNYSILKESFLDVFEGEKQEQLHRILYDMDLICESARIYVDRFNENILKRDPNKAKLEYFLRNYDIDKKVLRRPSMKRAISFPSYRSMWIRIAGRDYSKAEEKYVSVIEKEDPGLADEVKEILKKVSQGNEEQQVRSELYEMLSDRSNAEILDQFGSNKMIYSLLIALHGESSLPKAKRVKQKKGKDIGEHLGTSKRGIIPPTFDIWSNCFSQVTCSIPVTLYDRNTAIQRILRNNFLLPLLERYEKGERDITSKLEEELANEPDLISERLISYALNHFQLMEETECFPEVRKHLSVVKIKEEYVQEDIK